MGGQRRTAGLDAQVRRVTDTRTCELHYGDQAGLSRGSDGRAGGLAAAAQLIARTAVRLRVSEEAFDDRHLRHLRPRQCPSVLLCHVELDGPGEFHSWLFAGSLRDGGPRNRHHEFDPIRQTQQLRSVPLSQGRARTTGLYQTADSTRPVASMNSCRITGSHPLRTPNVIPISYPASTQYAMPRRLRQLCRSRFLPASNTTPIGRECNVNGVGCASAAHQALQSTMPTPCSLSNAVRSPQRQSRLEQTSAVPGLWWRRQATRSAAGRRVPPRA